MKYLLLWPLANIRHNRWTSAAAVLGIALAAFGVTTLLGFVGGYEKAVARDVDRMGFDLLVTAKGCPYEAATLMLRGGVGLRYMPDGVVERLRGDDRIAGVYPTLIHPVRDPSTESGMVLLKGVTDDLRDARGLELREGTWFDAAAGAGVVLGYEAAEFEQRHARAAYLLPGEEAPLPVLGVLERTGSQADGTVLLRLSDLQARYGLDGKLTGTGVKVAAAHVGELDAIREAWNAEPELQVVSLSGVVEALRISMANMRDVVRLLAWVLALMAGAVLLNTTLLRTLAEHRKMFTLHAIGISNRFIYGAAILENLLLVAGGAALGIGGAMAAGAWSSSVLTGYLPYAPSGNLVAVTPAMALAVAGAALAVGLVATLPPLLRLRWFSGVGAFRGDG